MTYGGRLLVCVADATLNILSDTLKDTALSLPSFHNLLNPLTPTVVIWLQL